MLPLSYTHRQRALTQPHCPRLPKHALPTAIPITLPLALTLEAPNSHQLAIHILYTHIHVVRCATFAMRISLPLLSTLLLPLLCAASPTPIFSRALAARAVVTPRPSPTAPPTRRQPEFSLSLSIPPVSIPSLSLDLPKETCTPGFISYETPGLNGHVSAAACNAKWAYSPNFAAAIAFSFLFGVLTLAHVGQAVVYRNGFCWVIIMAGLWETGAYVFRALGSKDQQSDGKSIVASILVLVGPVCKSPG